MAVFSSMTLGVLGCKYVSNFITGLFGLVLQLVAALLIGAPPLLFPNLNVREVPWMPYAVVGIWGTGGGMAQVALWPLAVEIVRKEIGKEADGIIGALVAGSGTLMGIIGPYVARRECLNAWPALRRSPSAICAQTAWHVRLCGSHSGPGLVL